MWQGCAVTGARNTQILVAAHIKPWRVSTNQERLDRYNDLFPLANLDKAFDLGFISFENCGRLMISNQFDALEVMGIKGGMAMQVRQEHRRYLDYHREELFRAG